MADMRDRYLPYVLRMFNRREVLELAYGARSFENARKARDDLFGDQNNRKRYNGYLAGLLDPQIWAQLQAREQKLRDAIARDPKLRSTTNAYDRIKKAQAEIAKVAPTYNYLEIERPKDAKEEQAIWTEVHYFIVQRAFGNSAPSCYHDWFMHWNARTKVVRWDT